MTEPRHPRAEAAAIAGAEFDPRVLEPSPPYAADDDYKADDPVAIGEACGRLLMPTGLPGGDLTWDDWLADHPEHTEWVTERWLGGARRLPPVPTGLTASRLALHRLSFSVMAPIRYAVCGTWAQRFTVGGFGTPFFGDDDRQIRVEGTTLVDQRGHEVRTAPITTLRAAADFLGSEVDPDLAAEGDSPPAGDIDEPLAVDEDSVAFLAAWYGMAFAALEMLRSDEASTDASRPQLWPGHFDPAIEIGDENHRGSWGASPGDHAIEEPYLYAAPWYADRLSLDADDPFLNAPSFTGAILKVSDFPADQDAVTTAIEFWRRARDIIFAG